ncbi:MAG: SDR family oxidoreductase [Desulfofustis sp.]
MDSKTKRILLAGATGYLGQFVLKELLYRGYQVRALVRDAGKIEANDYQGLEVCEAEITDRASISGCCAAMDVVISTVGITRQKDGLSYMDVDYQANVNLLEEARSAGVEKCIYVSALNADKLTHLSICRAKELFVDRLKNSGLDFCVIRPNGFFSDMAAFLSMARQGRVYLFGSGQFRSNPIHGADLAAVCVDAIDSAEHEIEVGGPETLSHEHIARIAFASLDKTPRITCIPEWLRKCVLRSLQLFTKESFHGPIEFFLTVMAMDMIAPQYGSRTLKKFFSELSEQG